MKRYSVFAISFILIFLFLFIWIEVLFGFFLTTAYNANTLEAWHVSARIPQEVEIVKQSDPFLFTLVLALLSANIAYFISQKYS